MNFDRVEQLDELSVKRVRLTELMKQRGWEAVILTRRHNFAWATGGADNHVRDASELGVASLVFFREGRRAVVTSNIEVPRIMGEELPGMGFEVREVPWFEPEERFRALRELLRGRRVAADDGTPGTADVEPFLPALRMALTSHEIKKYRWLGRQAGAAIGEACRQIRKGMTEEEVAGRLYAAVMKRGARPSVALVAADDRLNRYRHPIPTENRVGRAAMAVLCARRWGLVCSVTRLVHFGKADADLKRKHEAVAHVDGVFISNTRPGTPMVDVFNRAREAYAAAGYPDEWRLHHQGGPTGYVEREFTVGAGTPRREVVRRNTAFAWNPSITGTKSEDTILATAKGPEVITATPGWPMLTVTVGGRAVRRPGWLIKSAGGSR